MTDEEQQQKETLIQLQTVETKKALIVVGKAGHGKSSFVRMLTQKRNDQAQFSEHSPKSVDQGNLQKPIIIGCGANNGTDSCNLFKVDPSHELLPNGEDLYVIDTPGIDFNASIFLMMEQIDEIICKNHCEIVGIAYVINISQRQQVKHGQQQVSLISQFMRLLKIKQKFKNNLIFFILSKWDENCRRIETFQNNLQIFHSMINKQMQISSFKFVKWVSKPSLDFQTYLDFLESKKHQGGKFVDEQWKQLKDIISSQLSKKCSFLQYQKSFDQYIREIYKIFTTKQYEEKKVKTSNFRILSYQKKKQHYILKKYSEYLQFFKYFFHQLRIAFKSSSFETKHQDDENFFGQNLKMLRYYQLYNQSISSYLNRNTSMENSTLIIPNKKWFKSIKVFQKSLNHQINIGFIQNIKNQELIRIDLINQTQEQKMELLLKCQTKYPTVSSLERDVKQVIDKVYNNKSINS